jgi:AAA ATPase domain
MAMTSEDQRPMPPPPAHASLADRLQAARLRAFVGRARELATFRAALAEPERPLTVLYLTGPGGIGKSSLLRRFAQEAEAADRKVIAIDARSAECTPEAFLARSAEALTGGRSVLLIDVFELYRPLESWLREQFLPRLPLGTIVVFGSRLRPAPEWRNDPAWDDVLEVVDVAELPNADAAALLDGRSGPEVHRRAVLDFARGNPLVLSVAAEAAVRSADGADAAADWTPSHKVIDSLVTRLVGNTPSPDHRQALDVCTQAHMITETMLRAALANSDADAGAIFTWLRDLPFMESGPHGLYPHGVVRDVLDADLRWRDPAGHRSVRDRILTHIDDRLQSLRASSDSEADSIIRYLCSNALYLQRDEFGRPSRFGGRRAGDVYEDVHYPWDRSALLELVARANSAQYAAIIEYWLDRQPEAFRVVRRADTREVTGLLACVRLTQPRREDREADPFADAAWAHVGQDTPPRPGEHLLLVHSAWAADDVHDLHDLHSDATAHVLGAHLMARLIRDSGLAWSFVVVSDFEAFYRNPYNPEHLRRDDAVRVGDRPYWLYCTDRRRYPLRVRRA